METFWMERSTGLPSKDLTTRVAALEQEVARLRRTLESQQGGKKPWWEQITDTFARDRVYHEAMRLGEEQRHNRRVLVSQQRRDRDVHT